MKNTLHSITTRIRRLLAAHYDLVHLKRAAFAIALGSCLSLGSIMLFPLFSLSLHHTVGLSYTEINVIVSLLAIGMYFCLPVLGYLADCYGPALLLIILIWAFCPAYFVNAVLVREAAHLAQTNTSVVMYMSASFWLIGLATSLLYFSSLLTCARIYPERKSLAILLPVAFYGLSLLLGAHLMNLLVFRLGEYLLLHRVFMFFAILYLVVGALNLVANSIVTIEQDIIFGDVEPTETDALLEPTRSLEPPNHRSRYIAFLKDPSAWVLLGSLFFTLGPMESFQNNLGLIIEYTGSNAKLADQVLIIAALSTVTRLLIGVVADWVSSENRRYPVCKVWLLLGLVAVGVVGQYIVTRNFVLLLILTGISYGGLFTAYPTVVASVWGVDLMGSTWGSFMVGPALGSITFSLVYGKRVDACGDGGCLDGYFKALAVCVSMSLVLVVVAWRGMWWRRGLHCF